MNTFKGLGEIIAALIANKERQQAIEDWTEWPEDPDLFLDQPELEQGKRYRKDKRWLNQ